MHTQVVRQRQKVRIYQSLKVSLWIRVRFIGRGYGILVTWDRLGHGHMQQQADLSKVDQV